MKLLLNGVKKEGEIVKTGGNVMEVENYLLADKSKSEVDKIKSEKTDPLQKYRELDSDNCFTTKTTLAFTSEEDRKFQLELVDTLRGNVLDVIHSSNKEQSSMNKLLSAATAGGSTTQVESYLKFEYSDGTLLIKKMSTGEFFYKTVFELDMEMNCLRDAMHRLRELLRDGRGNIFITTNKYDINMELTSTRTESSLRISIMETAGQQSKPLGQDTFNKYMGGKKLLDGIREFIERNDIS